MKIHVFHFSTYRYFDEKEMIDHVGDIEYMGQTTNTPAALLVNPKIFDWIFNFQFPPVLF